MWKKIYPGILNILQTNLENSDARWSSLTAFLCGPEEVKSKPTVVVTIDGTIIGRANANWAQLTLQIQSVLTKNDLQDWEVEFAYGKVSFSRAVPIMSTRNAGDSLGVVDTKFTGSMGGFIGLSTVSNTQMRWCAVTAHHVVRPEPEDTVEFQSDLLLQPQDTSHPRAVKVRSPSPGDYKDTLARLIKELDMNGKTREGLEVRRAKQHRGLSARQESEAKELENVQRKLEEKLAWLTSREQPFGRVVACSGLHANERSHMLDWALVEVGRENLCQNYPIAFHELPDDPGHAPPEDYQWDGRSPNNKIERMKLGEWVVMRGRTSGTRTGRVHKLPVAVKRWEIPGLPETLEWLIAPTRSAWEPAEPAAFAKSGDSGAWVYNGAGAIVGQVIAEGKREVGRDFGLSIVTPVHDLFQDIEEATGAELYLPMFDEMEEMEEFGRES
ncbi:MAG: hypothetical protein LQ340_007705 [Diploschistes diacapsis]|nr:MAG: hypothetical protein LQ340_007705 [Diploschistes diacapsis]